MSREENHFNFYNLMDEIVLNDEFLLKLNNLLRQIDILYYSLT